MDYCKINDTDNYNRDSKQLEGDEMSWAEQQLEDDAENANADEFK